MKNISKITLITCIGALTAFSSCVTKEEKIIIQAPATAVNVDSLMGLWNQGWNTKDTVLLASIIAEDGFVMMGSYELEGRDSIMQKWVRQNIPVVTNLQTTSRVITAAGDAAWYTGYYTLDVVVDGEKTGSEEGNLTFVWRKQADASWKLEVMHMGSLGGLAFILALWQSRLLLILALLKSSTTVFHSIKTELLWGWWTF